MRTLSSPNFYKQAVKNRLSVAFWIPGSWVRALVHRNNTAIQRQLLCRRHFACSQRFEGWGPSGWFRAEGVWVLGSGICGHVTLRVSVALTMLMNGRCFCTSSLMTHTNECAYLFPHLELQDTLSVVVVCGWNSLFLKRFYLFLFFILLLLFFNTKRFYSRVV